MAKLRSVNYIDLEDGTTIEITGDVAPLPGLNEINLNSMKELKEILSVIEQGVMVSNTSVMKYTVETLLAETAKKKVEENAYDSNVTRDKEIDLLFGRVSAPVFSGIYDNLTSTERIISLATDEAMVRISNMVPDRKCAEIMDMVTHRTFINMGAFPVKTLQEHVQREGLAMEAYEDKYTSGVLQEAGFDPKTAKPINDEAIQELLPDGYMPFTGPASVSELVDGNEKLAEKVAGFNKNKAIDEQIPAIMTQNQLTLSTVGGPDCLNISLDDVCVKQQAPTRPKKTDKGKDTYTDDNSTPLSKYYPEYKEDYKEANENADLQEEAEEVDKEDKEEEEKRKNNGKKKGRKKKGKKGKKPSKPRVWNTVATVELGDSIFYIRTASKKKSVARILACIISHKLVGKPIAVFVDGDQNITATVNEYLGFCNPVIVLDWYHLAKKVDSFVSLTFDGLIEEKRLIRKHIKSLLWVGNVAGAMDYISSFDPEKIKSKEHHEGFLKYLENKEPLIPCYALRKLQGLKNSSNSVEGANNQIVSSRQKHRGMAWSWDGSGALAELKAAELNGGLPLWLAERRLPHEFVPKPEKDKAGAKVA